MRIHACGICLSYDLMRDRPKSLYLDGNGLRSVQACLEGWRCNREEFLGPLNLEPGRFLRRPIVRRKSVRRDFPGMMPLIDPLQIDLPSDGSCRNPEKFTGQGRQGHCDCSPETYPQRSPEG